MESTNDTAQSCPKCGGEMWDNRQENAERKARGDRQRPDWACKDRTNCGGVIWPPRDPNEPRVPAKAKGTPDDPACPTCQGKMWDNRKDKRNPKAPDFKCRDKSCDGVVWPPRDGQGAAKASAPAAAPAGPPAGLMDGGEFPDYGGGDDDMPF